MADCGIDVAEGGVISESARPAGIADVEIMALLAEAGIAEQVDSRGGSIWHRREARALPAVDDLAAAVSASDQFAVVGTIDGVVIGYGTVATETLRDGALLARVIDLFVDPGARKVGVGEAMMDLLVAQAEEWGCIGIDTVVLPGNRDTKNFFESYGLVARNLTVHRSF